MLFGPGAVGLYQSLESFAFISTSQLLQHRQRTRVKYLHVILWTLVSKFVTSRPIAFSAEPSVYRRHRA